MGIEALLSPFMSSILPYAIIICGLGAVYITRLRKKNQELKAELTKLQEAYDSVAKALQTYKEAYDKYRQLYEAQSAADLQQEKKKTAAVEEAKTVQGADSGKITQEDLDKIKTTKAKKK